MDNCSENCTTHQGYPVGAMWLGYAGSIIGVHAILLNVIFLVCLCQIPNDRDSSYTQFITNLSLCDIFGSFFFIVTQNWPQGPFAQITGSRESSNLWTHGSPYIFRSIPWMFFTAYMITLSCLSASQYLAACRPHVYVRVRGTKCVTYVLMAIWLLASLQIAIPIIVLLSLTSLDVQQAFKRLIFISKIEMVCWLMVYIVSTCVSIGFNALVYMELKRLKKKLPSSKSMKRNRRNTIMHFENPHTESGQDAICSENEGCEESEKEAQAARQAFIQYRNEASEKGRISQDSGRGNSQTKNEAFVTILCLSVATIFCRLPFPLVGMLLITVIERRFGFTVMSWTLVMVVLLLYLVFLVDPVIYLLRMPDVTRFLRVSLRKCRGNASRCRGEQENKTNDVCIGLTSTAQSTAQSTALCSVNRSTQAPQDMLG